MPGRAGRLGLQRQPHGGAAQLLVLDVDGGEVDVGRRGQVVEPGQRDVLRNAEPPLPQRLARARGDQVVAGEDRGEVPGSAVQPPAHHAVALVPLHRALDLQPGVVRQPVRGKCRPVPGDPALGRAVSLAPAEEQNAGVAGRDEVAGDRLGSAGVVVLDDDGRYVRPQRGPAAQHQVAAGQRQRAGVLRHALAVGVVGADVPDEDDGFRVLFAHQPDDGQLPFGIAAAGADEAQPALARGLVLNALGDVRVVRRGHGVDHDGHAPGLHAREPAGVGVGHVVELAYGAHHLVARDGRAGIRAGENPGDGGDRDPRVSGDVADRRGTVPAGRGPTRHPPSPN